MDWYRIREFEGELETVRDFLFDAVLHESRISRLGLKTLQDLKFYTESTEILRSMETELSSLLRTARFFDSDIYERLKKILDKSPLFDRATEIGLSVSLAEGERRGVKVLRPILDGAVAVAGIFGVNRLPETFADEGPIPLKRMLIDVERLLPLISQLERSLHRKDAEADRDFKPSNVDREKVKILLDKAILGLEKAVFSNEATKIQLTDYLTSATSELSRDDPNWRKLVGALVISATILGGIAVAPDAVKNIEDALRYVLGSGPIDFRPAA